MYRLHFKLNSICKEKIVYSIVVGLTMAIALFYEWCPAKMKRKI